MQSNLDLSIVIPVFNEEESISELMKWVNNVLNDKNLNAEVILIDDGSTDASWNIISQLSQQYNFIKGLRFKRNYGKSAALQTGFDHAAGNVVITMDADLQDSPEEIPALISMINENGYDMVSGWKKRRHDPLSKTIPSKFFNYITRLISGINLHDFNCGLKAYEGSVVKNIQVYGEMHRYIPLIAKWNGFKNIGEKVVEHRARKYGVTKFGLERFLNGFLDLMSVTFVHKFKKKPMHFFGSFGIFSFLLGIFITIYLISEKLYNVYYNQPVRDIVDQPLFFLALVAVILGVQLFLSGFLAEMMIQIATRSKNEYLIVEKVGDKE
ncbi:MAG TPA: glycosyltransferase family 2 protein [Cyclobacteriaceae bacterium]